MSTIDYGKCTSLAVKFLCATRSHVCAYANTQCHIIMYMYDIVHTN